MLPLLSKKAAILLLLSLVTLTTAATEPVVPQCPSSRHPRKAKSQQPTANSQQLKANSQQLALYQGDKRQLVYLVAFSDLKFKEEDPMVLWDKVFNQPDFVEGDFVGSVHDYFRDQSYGQLLLQFDLMYMEMDERAKYRSGYIGNTADDSRAGLLLTELLDKTKETIPDWSVYDWDGDGYVDQILILFAGKGQNDGGGSNSIWANQWWLSEQSEEPYNREWGHPYEVADGLLVNNYGVFPELTGKGTYGTFGTLCHEYGHCLGLPDFYYNGSTQVVGPWDIMDYGNYNDGGFRPPGYSAHERMCLGWLDITELTEPFTVSAMDALNSEQPQAWLVRNDGYADEYYVIENRQQTGWDASLPGSGLVVFHIDYDEEVWHNGVPNSSSYKRYSIIPANNTSSRNNWAYPYMASGFVINNELTNTSKPAATLLHVNSDGTKLMSKPITNMKVENGLASFDFMGGTPTGITEVSRSSSATPQQLLYQYGPIRIVRLADGTIQKMLRR